MLKRSGLAQHKSNGMRTMADGIWSGSGHGLAGHSLQSTLRDKLRKLNARNVILVSGALLMVVFFWRLVGRSSSGVGLWSTGATSLRIDTLNRGVPLIPLAIVEQHGAVLQYWISALERDNTASREKPRGGDVLVVHVDTHSDYMDVSEQPSKLKSMMQDSDGNPEESLMADPSIGDFITRALFAKLVSVAYYIRSDFVIGEYNGPKPGRWNGKVGMLLPFEERAKIPERAKSRSKTNRGEEKGDEDDDEEEEEEEDYYEDDSAVLCMGDMKLEEEWTGTLENQNRIEGFGRCKDTIPSHDKRYELIVSTTQKLMLPKSPVKEWILDIDLDFFSSYDPSAALFDHYGFDFEFVKSSFLGAFTCSSNENNDMKQLKVAMRHLAKHSSKLNLGYLENVLEEVGNSCDVLDQKKAVNLLAKIKNFTPIQLSRWLTLWKSDIFEWTGDFMAAFVGRGADTSPQGILSNKEILGEVSKLERSIKAFQDKYGNPQVITVSRSEVEDHYLPSKQAPFIQSEVFKMLNRLFPEQLEPPHYHEDVPFKRRTVPGAEPT